MQLLTTYQLLYLSLPTGSMVKYVLRHFFWRMSFAGMFVLGVTFVASGQSESESCLNAVKKCYRQMNVLSELPEKGNAYYLKYRTVTEMRAEELEKATTTVEIILTETNMIVRSHEMEVYGDKKNMFTVIPTRRLIYHGDGRFGSGTDGVGNIIAMQDSVFDGARVISCHANNVTIGFSKMLSNTLQVDSVHFKLTKDNEVIKSAKYHYSESSEYKSVEYAVDKIDYKYNWEGANSASQFVYDDQNKLKTIYENYKLINVRTKKGI